MSARPIETRKRVRALIADGATSQQIADATGTNKSAVLRLVREYGLGPWSSRHAALSIIPDTFVADHAVMTFWQLAEKYSRGFSTVQSWAKRLGLVTPRPTKRENVTAFRAPVEAGPVVRRDAMMDARPRSSLPAAPCFRCGARGFCGHDGRVAEAATADARRAA